MSSSPLSSVSCLQSIAAKLTDHFRAHALRSLVTDWHSYRGLLKFGYYAEGCVAEGNAKKKIASGFLRDLFELDTDPTQPRKLREALLSRQGPKRH